jgi:hypothetical protein
MIGRRLQDHLYKGLGACARHIGTSTDAFRPSGALDPLDKVNRYIRLPTMFVPANGNEFKANAYGDVLWQGIFDGGYTRPGDYLVKDTETYFIASQAPLLPILCVKANRTLAVCRPNMQLGVAGNHYGGYTSANNFLLLRGWPAAVLGNHRASTPPANLPTDPTGSLWKVLLPAIHGVVLTPGDIITDDLNQSAVIQMSEVTDLGWKLSAKMTTT